ncbi:response regulator [Sansalvadorimonas sp. 2012CJ34-2]|uniref:Response regulator n=1 Tax=Parendozoicomonas callyspongiae TaxID=2942213 RepID=A0ABT0PI36_9GAMM|nr:HD domain-containing phosphohydrolase [Sansalvadorimonas sp. 2012CJ34-2]MCL6271054.1 response regulator [Sansalvadorimonas sp. 2012CJ34-2]
MKISQLVSGELQEEVSPFVSQDESQVVLVVDDTPENIDVLREVLQPDYRVKAALNGLRALKIARSSPRPSLILLDIMMPGMDGYEVCRQLKADARTSDIPVIFVSAMTSDQNESLGLSLGAVDYIAKPVRPEIVRARVNTHLALHDQTRCLEQLVAQRTRELRESRLQVINCLGRAAEFKDNETGLHVTRMSLYVRLLAQALNEPPAWVELLHLAAPMHDIGKIGIPDGILLKPGKLAPEEWELMKRHTEFGGNIIGEHDSELMRLAKEVALNHHEKWDGTGYPKGLEGEDIPLSARVVAIADVFDALTSERSYKKAWPVEDTVSWMDEQCGAHFDPKLIEVFHQVLPEILKVREQYAED